jgi:hypothetical protein
MPALRSGPPAIVSLEKLHRVERHVRRSTRSFPIAPSYPALAERNPPGKLLCLFKARYVLRAVGDTDQNVGLATAFGKLLDLRILGDYFFAKESDLPFQAANVSLREVGAGRDLSGHVAVCRLRLSLGLVWISCGDTCRALSRQVGTCRDWLSRRVVAIFFRRVCADLSRQVVTCRGWSNLYDMARDAP